MSLKTWASGEFPRASKIWGLLAQRARWNSNIFRALNRHVHNNNFNNMFSTAVYPCQALFQWSFSRLSGHPVRNSLQENKTLALKQVGKPPSTLYFTILASYFVEVTCKSIINWSNLIKPPTAVQHCTCTYKTSQHSLWLHHCTNTIMIILIQSAINILLWDYSIRRDWSGQSVECMLNLCKKSIVGGLFPEAMCTVFESSSTHLGIL